MTTDAITIEQKAQRILQLADELGAGIVDCTTKQWLMPAFASHIQSIDLGFYASERFIEHVLENHFFTSVPSPATNITEAPASTLDTAMEAFEESPDMGTAMRYLNEAWQYRKDGMVGDAVLDAALQHVLRHEEQQAPISSWQQRLTDVLVSIPTDQYSWTLTKKLTLHGRRPSQSGSREEAFEDGSAYELGTFATVEEFAALRQTVEAAVGMMGASETIDLWVEFDGD